MVLDTVEKQLRVLPLFEYASIPTKEKFALKVHRDPKLQGLGVLGRGQLFSLFHAEHLAEATKLYEVLIGAKTFEEFLDFCHQVRDFVNEGLYVYAVSVAILHRPDCKGVSLPPIQEIFPDKFMPVQTMYDAYKEAWLNPNKEEDIIVDMQSTGNILDPEYNLAYYREDIGINAHHWHWHIVYPATWRPEVIGKVKDRKGELFYYMHQQMCARYDCERLSNGMPRMEPFHNFHDTLEGYSSHLSSSINGLPYPSRPDGMTLQDLKEVSIQELERWRDRILDAIHIGHLEDENGSHVPLDETRGIDVLGAIVEASYESVNQAFYGSIHNWGHVITARVQDPDGRYHLNPGVMSDTATSLRDPIFYRWHRFIDNMFQDYKETLPHYNHSDLEFPGIEITKVLVKAKHINNIDTFKSYSLLDLSHAYEFGRSGAVKVRFSHLNHEDFDYKIRVENHTSKTKPATVRVFMAPKYDELGNELNTKNLRRLMIEMDKFHAEIHPGHNDIVRHSKNSSVTISSARSFGQLAHGEGVNEHANEYCSCGWPDHLLVPRGNENGMPFHLFVMLTDWLHDQVGDHGKTGMCTDAVSYCGAKDQLYPDRRPMGFPFDRDIEEEHLKDWLLPNMKDVLITVTHHEEVHNQSH
ncbi:hemocyanin B chain-like isoform X2 [Tachypleus tridentatus]|uniref:hemocyanin B chain-like isoform X2 n=1 Tax=Tachypleus tridentatus TaxID=6853 RepID=UPI003FD18947